MAEYINRDLFAREVNRLSTNPFNEWDTMGILLLLDTIPTADVQPVVHGHWIWAEGVHVYGVDSDVQHGSVRCSACGNCSPHSTNYCGICGARMDGNQTDNIERC